MFQFWSRQPSATFFRGHRLTMRGQTIYGIVAISLAILIMGIAGKIEGM